MTRARRPWIAMLAALAGAAPAIAAEASPSTAPTGGVTRAADRSGRTPGESARSEPGQPKPVSGAKSAVVNPFEPFLKQWIDPRNRPALAVAKDPAGAAPLPLPPTVIRPPSTSDPTRNVASGESKESNPYLVASTPPPARPQPQPSPASTVSSGGVDAAPATLTAPESPLSPPSSGYRPPPPKDAKYFPQQKRF